jgi:hypothetical protein
LTQVLLEAPFRLKVLQVARRLLKVDDTQKV